MVRVRTVAAVMLSAVAAFTAPLAGQQFGAGALLFNYFGGSVAQYYGTIFDAMLSRATEDVHVHLAQAQGYVQDDLEVIRTGKPLVKEELNTAPVGD